MRCLMFVSVILVLCTANPVPSGTTTARYSLGGQTHLTHLPQSNHTRVISIIRTTFKPKNISIYPEIVLNLIEKTKFRGQNVRKLEQKDKKIFANFVKNTYEDLNTLNKTLKVNATNTVKISSNSKLRKKVTKKPALPTQVIINVSKPVNVGSQKKVTKITKHSATTNPPFRIKLSPRPQLTTVISNKATTTKKPKTKPTVKRIVTKWSDRPTINEIKQAWYEEGVPYPSPQPEISSNSPQVSLSDVASLPSDLPQNNVQEDQQADLSNAVSTFNLDMAPELSNTKDSGSPCPTVHISSAVLTPQQRQDCSDLNLVINSHFHQNTASDRTPIAPETYDAAPVGEDPAPVPQADPGVGSPQADAPAGGAPGGGSGGTGGSGGSGGNGGDGDNGGGLKLPDLKGLFDFIRYLHEKLGHLLGFLKNPYLYLVPIALFFALGFILVLLLFPWWIPALFLVTAAKTASKKSNVAFYKHVHKPVHHADGWFWNHETKTWQNVAEFHRHSRFDRESLLDIPNSIEKFSQKYPQNTTQSWKWRRRNRSPTQIGETIKLLTNQLMETNATVSDSITLDTRTPPKVKQHTKKKISKIPETLENSHAGIAIPVNEDDILNESTKTMNVIKVEKPTTNSGISTWILLSGQTTPKPSRKPVIKPHDRQNMTVLINGNKNVKPIFKKRTTVTPPTTVTKVKASELIINKKTTPIVTNTTSTTTTAATTILTTTKINTTEATTTSPIIKTTLASNSSLLPVEAKEGETDLSDNSDKKTKRPPTNKRKKNKNRRRRPSEKSEEETKIDKPLKSKEKPIGTQLYNYLSREVMPTVGVGLVGLMVTAGLASYFLYPFGAARRSYDIDRKDKDSQYYYDDYSGGIAEEEAIGKVIAGMPSNSLYGNNFKTPTSRHSFSNNKIIEQYTGYTVASEEATPATVPEHGPRSLNFRKKRSLQEPISDKENEIDFEATVTTSQPVTATSSKPPQKNKSLAELLRELFHLKIHLGLQLIQNATQTVSKYVSHVQKRFDEHYQNYTLY